MEGGFAMRVENITKTKPIEEIIRTSYIAEDGTAFKTQQECEKYEESALFVVSNKLKRLANETVTHMDLNNLCSDNEPVEIFDIQTERDLDNLKQYLRLKLSKNRVSERNVQMCFDSPNGKSDFVINNITFGHEVMIFWDNEETFCWVYKDGSVNGYAEYVKDRVWNAIKKVEQTKEGNYGRK